MVKSDSSMLPTFLTAGRVLVVAAHPDDEVLGMGGTIHKLRRLGVEVRVLILGEGVTSRFGYREDEKSELSKHLREALKRLGVSDFSHLGFPDNRLQTVDPLEVVRAVEVEVSQFSPYTVFTHSSHDLNSDHGLVHEAVLVATRPRPDHCVKTVLEFRVASSSEWRFGSAEPPANLFVRLEDEDLEAKKFALQAYVSELEDFPARRSIEVLDFEARICGSVVGMQMAENFRILRIVVD